MDMQIQNQEMFGQVLEKALRVLNKFDRVEETEPGNSPQPTARE